MISVIVPTKDEPAIGELVNGIHEALMEVEHEVIIVDKSDLPPSIDSAVVVRQESSGLGKAILEGFKHATGNVITTMNGDFSHDPRDLPRMLAMIAKYDIVVGSRFAPGARFAGTVFRRLVSRTYRLLAKCVLGLTAADPLSGFWAARREVLSTINLNPMGFKMIMEILYKAKNSSFTIVEVPITFGKRQAGKSKAGVGEAIRTLLFMVKLRMGRSV